MGNKSCRSSPDLTYLLNNVIQETFVWFWGGRIGLFIFSSQMQCLCDFLLGQNRRNQNTIPSFSAVLIRSSNWCIQHSGLLQWQAIMWTAHRVFVIHLSGMQGPTWDWCCVPPLWQDNTCAGACREQTEQTMVELHEVTQKHCRDRGCKRNGLSIQLLLWEVQKDHTQDIPYPKLAVFILVRRLDLEGSKCWCVSDSSR